MTAKSAYHPRIQRLLAALALTVILTALLVNWRQAYSMDFLSFWAAGKLAGNGAAASAYDFAAHHAVHVSAVPVETRLPFGYPPFFLFALLPFGLLAYSVAAPLWVGATLAAYALAMRKLAPDFTAIALAFPPVVICAVTGQNGLLTAALFIGGIALMPSRPWLSGLLLGCLAIKPQLGVLIPFALLAGREWRTIAGATLAVLGLTAASFAVFGWSAWQGFFDQAGVMSTITTDNAVGWQKMASVFAGMRLAGAPDLLAWAVHGICALLAAIFVWCGWRRTDDPLARAAILAPATLLVSPYLYVYDQAMLMISLIWLAKRGLNPVLLLGLCALPLVQAWQFGNANAVANFAPLLTLGLLILVQARLSDPSAITLLWGKPRGLLDRHDLQTG